MATRETARFIGALNPPADPRVIDWLRAETGVALPGGHLTFFARMMAGMACVAGSNWEGRP